MPLSKPLMDLLGAIQDKERRERMLKDFESEPTIQDRFAGNLRQEDYDRNLNQHKQELTRLEASVREAEKNSLKWSDWAKINVPIHEQLNTNYSAVVKERDELQIKNKALATAGNGNGNGYGGDEEAQRQVNVKLAEFEERFGRVPTQQQIEEMVKSVSSQVASGIGETLKNDFLKITWPQSLNTVIQTTNYQLKYAKEFPGEEMEPLEFLKFLGARNAPVPTKELYDEFVRPKREAANTVKFEKEKQDFAADQVRQALSGRDLPGSGVVGTTVEGPVVMRRQNSKLLPEIPADLTLGTNQIAALAAAKLRAGGAS